MKKVLSVALASAMVLGMGANAFADFSRIRKVSAGVGRNDKAEPWRTPQRGAAGTPPRNSCHQNKKQKLQQSRVVTKKLQKRMAKGRLQEKRVKTAWLSGKVLINHHKK